MKSDTSYERELRDILKKHGWLVIRSAGSFAYDLISLKVEEHRIIEVKADRGNQYYTTNNKEQFDELNELAKKGFNCYYYIRWKGKPKEKQWECWKLPLKSYPIFRIGEGTHVEKL
jgi:Holliday junction resolvase